MGIRLRIDGARLRDSKNREVLLHGINASGDAKLPLHPNQPSHEPAGFFKGDDVSFVGRPFEVEDAGDHFSRLRKWGYNTIRYVFTWEAIEHEGPGKYDEEFVQHTVAVLRIAKSYGFHVFMDPHQDVWSRFTGGSGAPMWTLYACGLDPEKFLITQAALVQNCWPEPLKFPKMIWATNYTRLACQVVFTMFWAGKDYTPLCKLDGVNIQDYLQNHFIAACQYLAKAITEAGDLHYDPVIGWESMNEPNHGLVGMQDLSEVPSGQRLKLGTSPTAWQAMLTGSGFPVEQETWAFGGMGPYKSGSELVDPRGETVWLSPSYDDTRYGWKRDPKWRLGECVWALHGVWEPSTQTLLKKDYFAKDTDTGAEIDYEYFTNKFWMSHYRKYRDSIRQVFPNTIMFAQPPTLEVPPTIKGTEDDDLNMIYAPHWYDGVTLMTKKWNTLWNVDVFGVLRGKYWAPAFAIKIGERAIRNCFRSQLSAIRQEGIEYMGTHPCVFTEIGIPYDMNDANAYKTGDYSSQIAAMDANHFALEGSNMSFTFWNYTGTNQHKYGDQWNGEDLSIFSLDDPVLPSHPSGFSTDPSSPSFSASQTSGSLSKNLLEHKRSMSVSSDAGEDDGLLNDDKDGSKGRSLRAANAYVRPYPAATVGDLISHGFDLKNCVFTMTLTASEPTAEDAPTEVFLPSYHFEASGLEVETTGGRHELVKQDGLQYLKWWHGDGEQQLRVKGTKVRAGLSFEDDKDNNAVRRDCIATSSHLYRSNASSISAITYDDATTCAISQSPTLICPVMSSPAKRRKLNNDVTPSKPTRGLDFFFKKQSDDTKHEKGPLLSSLDDAPSHDEDVSGLTDEQLARRLQEQWDKEDQRAPSGSGDTKAAQIEAAQVVEDELEDMSKSSPSPKPPTSMENAGRASQEQQEAPTESGDRAQHQTLSLQSATAAEDTTTTRVQLDQNPLTFNPSDYTADLKKQWAQEGGSATYALLTHCFVLVNSTQSRIKIVDTLVNLLRIIIEADPDSLLPAVWLATNSISPPYIDLELGLGGSAISKALKKVCGLDNAGLKTLYNKYGDAGDVAFEAKKRQSLTLRKPKPLSIKSVFESLVKIANSKGTGSQEAKQRIVERLVQDARGAEESRYIVRTLVQHLRIGAVKTTMLIALSRAFLLSRPSGAEFEIRDRSSLASLRKENLTEVWAKSEEIVKACFARHPNYNDLVPCLVEVGISDELLLRCGLAMHIPLRPMLGNITRDLGEMLTKLQGRDFTCEYKYDGQRAQVHCDERGKVTIFSRHLEIMTDKYPDLVALVPKIRSEGVSSFILEGEVVAVDRESGDLRPFQTLANRARKDVVINEVKIDVCLFAFDLMFLNGEELLDRSLRERRSLLRSLFTELPHHFTWVNSIDATSADADVVSDFFKQAIAIKCEGIMVKVLDNISNPDLTETADGQETGDEPAVTATPSTSAKGSKSAKDKAPAKEKGTRRKALLATYEPDKRVDGWLKVKKDYDSSAETLDLVPIGAWHGSGRKAKWWSPILLAVRNPETGCLEAVTKCISGFTDKFYQANKEKYAEGSENVISRPSYVDYVGEPAVWFQPQEVWEMAFADLTLSPTYTAAIGLVSEERGLSTRFPRFLKVREDKSIEEATTADYLATLYRQQESKAPKKQDVGAGGGDDDDVELDE